MDFDSSSNLTLQSLLAAQALACTVYQLFPSVILAGGGVNSLGFYYDFIFEQPLTEDLKEWIEVHFNRFVKEGHPLRFLSMMRENAQALFEHHHHFLLSQKIGEHLSNLVELVQIGDFYSICPTLPFTSTQEAGSVKILEMQALNQQWEGEELEKTRLLGVNRKDSKELKSFLKQYDSFLKKRDHRSLGEKLNLFSFPEKLENLGVVWHPKGRQLCQILQQWLRSQISDCGNEEVFTSLVTLPSSRPLESHRFNSFLFEEEECGLRSSFTDQHIEFLKRFSLGREEELPWRATEFGMLYRNYSDSQWWGLFCHCSYFADQTTICCLPEQVLSELISSLHFIEQIITIFGFEARWYLIGSRKKSGRMKHEKESIAWLRHAMESSSCFYPFSESQEEEGIPRFELRVRDVLGREWPISYVGVVRRLHLSFSEEKAFDCVFLAKQVWSSLDRWIALLLERGEGVLPFWLAPEQVRILVLGEANNAYAQQVAKTLRSRGLRVALDKREAKLAVRVYEAEKENVPYLVLIGEQERVKQKVSVRALEGSKQNRSVDLETFLNQLCQESLPPDLRGEGGEC